MECQNCNKENVYGAVYCIHCGEKISKENFLKAYKETGWGKFQGLIDKYNSLPIKKVTDHIVFKIVVMLLSIVFMLIGISGDSMKLRIAPSEFYQVQYDEETEEYYILSQEEAVGLGLYIPKFTDEIKTVGYNASGETLEEKTMVPKECELIVKKGAFSYMEIKTIRGGKTRQSLVFRVK